MAAEMSVKVQDAELRAGLERLRMALPLGGNMTPVMKDLGRALVAGVRMRFREAQGPDGQSWKPSWRAQHEGGQTLRETSRLRNSITFHADHAGVSVGTNVIYAAVHQFGATIRAKNAQFLAIPMTKTARNAGSPRAFPGGVNVAQTLNGQHIMVGKDGLAAYLLRRSVKIPARPFLGVSAKDKVELLRVMERHFEGVWER